MTRALLALALLFALSLPGSMALASVPSCHDRASVCVMPLRMMSPPPPRPVDLGRHPGERV
ncbi:MAG: hypothetical protein H6900_00580 [Rhodobacter sp.]|uniref:hypothetical protein n=1 Tax=Pararhodobacter sp. TaxID=2127056 RepID=UPI001DC85F4A|nr:hypothetical protein [Pararhodobacter sp.]MCB1346942.1 hypothetical protein [Paracoccaceae bacterium]MCC0071761.1 hypothetical protein [Rhodobacter sp.]HPD93970.1 hypothetical protein [Pararhodobacter sp.]